MKKLIIALFLFAITTIISSPVLADDSIKTQIEQVVSSQNLAEVNATVVYMTEKLESFAKALQVPAERVYSILVANQTIEAYSKIVILLLFLLGGAISMISAIIGYNKKNARWRSLNSKHRYVEDDPNYCYYDFEKNGSWMARMIIGGMICFISLTFIVGCSGNIISGIYNPEYGAIKEIMQMF